MMCLCTKMYVRHCYYSDEAKGGRRCLKMQDGALVSKHGRIVLETTVFLSTKYGITNFSHYQQTFNVVQ